MNHYDRGAVPRSVIDVADRVMRESADQKLQRVAALLIARGDEEFSKREQRLLAGLRSNRFYANLYPAFVELYGEDRFEDLVVRFAADTSVPVWLRSGAILDLGQRATPGAKLAGQTEEALLEAAKVSSEYPLISAIHSALTAWRIDYPFEGQKNSFNCTVGSPRSVRADQPGCVPACVYQVAYSAAARRCQGCQANFYDFRLVGALFWHARIAGVRFGRLSWPQLRTQSKGHAAVPDPGVRRHDGLPAYCVVHFRFDEI